MSKRFLTLAILAFMLATPAVMTGCQEAPVGAMEEEAEALKVVKRYAEEEAEALKVVKRYQTAEEEAEALKVVKRY